MPNYVTQRVELHGDPKIVELLLNTVLKKTDDDIEFDFNQIIPTPPCVLQGSLTLNAQNANPGRNWYDWRLKNWGTKWNALDCKYPDKTIPVIYFDTAWSVPEQVYIKLSELFPEINIEVKFIDEGWFFAGFQEYKDGKLHTDISIQANVTNQNFLHLYESVYQRKLEIRE